MTDPTTLVILGASGDLTSRLLLPGLGSLLAVEPDRRVRVIGADRADLDDAGWQGKVREAFAAAGVPAETEEAVVADARYVQADLLELEQLSGLVEGLSGPVVLYFALPPHITQQACELLGQCELPADIRFALEKPFGHERDSAQALNRQLLTLVTEDRIHRVDHFLGVNTILNLIGIRFANRLLEPMWSAEHIERVDISYDEKLALEGRAGYYDGAGALVDMIQSHLLQVLAFFAMEAPATLDEVEVRSVKAQVLRATRVWGGDPATASRRGRYTAGRIEERDVPSYVDEEGVDPAQETETLAEVVLEVANARWAGVPFVLRSGKALGGLSKRIVVTLRPPRHVPTGLLDTTEPDQLILDLKPGAVDVVLSMNAEGDPFALEQKVLRAELGKPRMLPYGEVLSGILDGDPLLSIRGDVAEDCWRIVDPVLAAWRSGAVPMQDYPAGSAGPDGWGQIPPRD